MFGGFHLRLIHYITANIRSLGRDTCIVRLACWFCGTYFSLLQNAPYFHRTYQIKSCVACLVGSTHVSNANARENNQRVSVECPTLRCTMTKWSIDSAISRRFFPDFTGISILSMRSCIKMISFQFNAFGDSISRLIILFETQAQLKKDAAIYFWHIWTHCTWYLLISSSFHVFFFFFIFHFTIHCSCTFDLRDVCVKFIFEHVCILVLNVATQHTLNVTLLECDNKNILPPHFSRNLSRALVTSVATPRLISILISLTWSRCDA